AGSVRTRNRAVPRSVCAGTVASGQFELQVNSFQNLYGELLDGRCCTGRRSGPDGRCVAPCRTFFRACVQQYAARHSALAPRSPCVLGNASTLVLGGNELKAHGTVAYGDTSTRIAVPFKFAWPRSFTLVLEAWHQKNATVAPEGSGLIMQTTHPGMVLPGVMWQNLHGHGPSMVVQYRIRVTCDENYFGSNCTRLCKPQNDYFGHYTCDTQGNKICREGWTGAGCKNAICRQGCSTEHGSCDVPGDCKCSYGWQGTYCDRCTTYPGCVHGTCQKPWDCNCNVNWGGMMCDKDLNYCGTRNLCLNGGTCINTQPDDYMCRCPDGYSGKTCKIVEKACLSNPCANGGSCTDTPQGFECSCPSSWTGPACTQDVDDCVSAPCAHGGTCQDTPDGFHCFCPSQWSGLTCQVDVDECKTNPCVHARFCKNLFGSYYCSCLPGWFGQDCDIGQYLSCQSVHRITLSQRGPECICPEGFLGVHCEIQPNACASLQCPHGMHCLIQSDTLPRCVCPPDSEHRCQEVDLCEPNPCQNGGLCSPLGGDYVCRCSDDYEGKNCSVPHDRCQSASCKGDSNLESAHWSFPQAIGPVTIVSSTVCGQHGHCVSLPGANFSCACDLGFTGSRCHENINDCAGKNCLNGATCVDGVNSFQCICPDGWNGDFCQNDDCIPNPCQHGGACADLANDFNCTCQGGWKGRTCHSRTSHCDASTCNNGGTCFEEGASFQCLCPPGWNGVTCSATQNNSCTPSPCENGATCIGAGDSSFICVCSEGWEGPTCSNNIDDCSSRPCSNGGRCIDGVNWYMCECAPGFAGPDCRININECQSSPCMSGGTCIDKINGYTCVCPPGKTGLNCMHGNIAGRNRYPSSTWMEDCNICQCSDGFKSCTKVWCGEKPCILSQQVGFGNSGCAAGHSCIPELRETCLMEPCHHIGRCLPSTAQPPTVCLPGIREQPFACTRIELVFERARAITTWQVCSELRTLASELSSMGLNPDSATNSHPGVSQGE
uniref:Delta-like protein n=1 Tax=Eptatretus burgeri TaxID=7764 RepID=A0A8C4NJP3_EPTBU